MNQPPTPHHHIPLLGIVVGIALLGAAAGLVTVLASGGHNPSKAASTKQAGTAQISTSNTALNSSRTSTSTSGNSASTNSPATNTNKQTPPVSLACKSFTAVAATTLFGAAAHSTAAPDTAAYTTTDTETSSCAYAADTQAIQLIMRTPKNSLGTSKNAVVFGSERPQAAISVSGYGQSAYWDPASNQLNILSQNIWYVLRRTQNEQPANQAQTEAAAKLLEGL